MMSLVLKEEEEGDLLFMVPDPEVAWVAASVFHVGMKGMGELSDAETDEFLLFVFLDLKQVGIITKA